MPDNMQELYRVIDDLRNRLAESEERINGLERSTGTEDDDTDDGFTTEDSFPERLGSANLDITSTTDLIATGITVTDKSDASWYAMNLGGERISPPLIWFTGNDLPTTTASAGDTATFTNSMVLEVQEITGVSTGNDLYVRVSLTASDELLISISSTDIDPMPLAVYHWFDRSAPDAPDAPTLTAGNTQIQVIWTKPLGFVNDYNIRYRLTGDPDWLDWEHDGDALTATITGLSNARQYEVQVQAANDATMSDWSASSTATPVATQTITTTAVVFTSLATFTGAFENEKVGSSDGQWAFDSNAGSTPSSPTGPGTNNALNFMHTETTGSVVIATVEGNGACEFASVPDGTDRVLHLRLCIQGTWAQGMEGVQINHRATSSDSWAQAGFIYGWAYANNYTSGSTVTDANGQTQTFAADGGWVDFQVTIPDTATEVQFQPRVVRLTDSIHTHDIAFRQFHWVYLGSL